MAIIRCPYCHAIIDENDKYCNNCGTQLLFPEDDEVEEEIPGEKIVDVEEDEEEKDYTLDAPGEAAPPAEAEAEAEETAEERTGELVTGPVEAPATGELGAIIEEEAGAAAAGAAEEEPEEVILVDEIAAREAAAAMEAAGTAEGEPEAPQKPAAPEEETKAYPFPAPGTVPSAEETVETTRAAGPAAAPPAPDGEEAKEGEENVRTGELDADDAGAPAEVPPAVPPTFDTRELDGLGKTVELGQERVEKMISVMADKQKEEAAAPAPEKRTGSLPPWAARIKGGAVPEDTRRTADTGRRFSAEESRAGAGDEEAARTAEVEEEIFPRRKPSDSGIGLPERIAQATLPFGAAAEEEREEEETEEAQAGFRDEPAEGPAAVPPSPGPAAGIGPRPSLREEASAPGAPEHEAELEEEEPRPPFRFSVFFKAKAFDILFVGVFWLVALWVAARSMDATLFELLSVTSGPVVVLYGVYIGLYFFLFKFFLGETLGDRLFRERD